MKNRDIFLMAIVALVTLIYLVSLVKWEWGL